MKMTAAPLLLILAIPVLSLWSGCETTERILDTAERVVTGRTGRTVIDIATSKDSEEALRKHVEGYARDPAALFKDLRAAQRDFETLMAALRGDVGRTWGKKEVSLPEQKRYVKYTQNYQSRAIVDFDTGEILVETLDDKDPRGSLKNAIVTTLLTPDDPRAVDLFSDKGITLTSDKKPYLLGLVVDQSGKSVRTPTEAESFADWLLEKRAGTRPVELEGTSKTAHFVKIAMVQNFAHKQAEKYGSVVSRFADKYKISPSLVFAIIRTESNFNPFAVSSAPAYGLMQLVPASGGREAYRKAKGQDEVPSRDYLFDAQNNIELGTAYLNVLTYDQLDRLGSAVSREYCVISAYNTGPRNVFRAFSNDPVSAVNQINSLQPPAVYEKLRHSLPYQETRDYLSKVVTSRKDFVSPSERAR